MVDFNPGIDPLQMEIEKLWLHKDYSLRKLQYSMQFKG